MERIVFLDKATVDAELRSPAFEHEWVSYDFTRPEETEARLKEATIAITNKVRIGEAELDAAPSLRMIAVAATGLNVVDLDVCKKRGVRVTNARDYATSAVAEHTFSLILALAKDLFGFASDVRAGEWRRSPVFCLTRRKVRSLEGSVLGIVGYGDSGRAVATRAKCFGMEVLVAERRGHPTREGRIPFDEVLSRADVLTLHAPLTEETENLIGEEELAAMKPSALLINTARGALVDERALLRALNTGAIGGAAVDVLRVEPPQDDPLLEEATERLIVTPHVAWRSDRAQKCLADQIVEAMESFVAGGRFNVIV